MTNLNMQAALPLLVWIVCAVGLLFLTVMVVVDMAGKFDYLQSHFPRLVKWSEKREMHGLMLLICFGLLVGDGYELITKEIPEAQLSPIIFQPQRPPEINIVKNVVPLTAESPDSLRRKTIKLVNDLVLFWSQKPQPVQQPIQNPTTDEERQRNTKWDQYWRDANAAYANAGFRERVLGIVRQYRAKGLDIGFLEQAAEQPERLVGAYSFGGIDLNGCSRYMTELCQLRELAYHVDAKDDMIILGP
jgi:hypothetical protein